MLSVHDRMKYQLWNSSRDVVWLLVQGSWPCLVHCISHQWVKKSIYCKTQFTSRQHNNNINYNTISINTQLICYMFRLFWAIIRHTLQELLFFSFVLQFLSYCIGDPFCITNHNYCLYGVRCPLSFVIGGGGFFPLVNLPVVLVYGYGRGSCHFCNFESLY